MKSSSMRKIVLLATASGLVASAAPVAQASEASTREAHVSSTVQSAPKSVVSVASNVVLNVARTPYTSYNSYSSNSGVTAKKAPAYTSFQANSIEEAASKAAAMGMTSWYYTSGGHTTYGGAGYTTAGNSYKSYVAPAVVPAATTYNNYTTAANTTAATYAATASYKRNNSYIEASTSTSGLGAKGAKIAAVAASGLGTAYSNTSNPGPGAGWNCTSYTRWVYKQATGIDIGWGYSTPGYSNDPGITNQQDQIQAAGGREVSQPQPGDLGVQTNGGFGVPHSVIYAGNGRAYAAINSTMGTTTQPISDWPGTPFRWFRV